MSTPFVHAEIWPDYLPSKGLTQIIYDHVPRRTWDNQDEALTWFIGRCFI